MYLWQGLDAETLEPYFQLASGAIIIGIALWMLWRTWAEERRSQAAASGLSHAHPHGHHHGADVRRLDTGHGVMAVEIFEDGVPPRWRIRAERGHAWAASDVWLVTERWDGARQSFAFADRGGYLESVEAIPEPHEFRVRISLGHGDHVHDHELSFEEDPHHDHQHGEGAPHGLVVTTEGYQDAHERAHATDIRRRFAGRDVSTWQIIAFGLTGGLIPCPAAITVLLLCLQLKEVTLGFALVLCFSIGLAVTLVTVGAAAALSVRHATSRWSWFGQLARKAPYFSGALIVMVGLYVAYHGWSGLAAQPAPQVRTQVSALP